MKLGPGRVAILYQKRVQDKQTLRGGLEPSHMYKGTFKQHTL